MARSRNASGEEVREEERKKDKERRARSRNASGEEVRKEERKKNKERMARSRNANLHSLIEQDTSFESICTVCMEFKSAQSTSNIDSLPLSAVRKYCVRTRTTMELDGTFSICNMCEGSIKRKQIPPKSERDLFQMCNFPNKFLSQVEKTIRNPNVQLNKVEQFILKLTIPFIRVAHCERGTQMKVRGNLILISADVASSLEKILPLPQNIVPIRFRRKLTYSGHYIAEYIDRRKVELYFNWFKKHNPLFKDVSLDDELLEKFEEDLKEEADTICELSQSGQEKMDTQQDDDDHLDSDNLEDEIDAMQPDWENPKADAENESSEDPADIAIWQQHCTVMSDKYATPSDSPTEANKLANLIVHLEQEGALPREVPDEIELDHMTDEIGEFFNQVQVQVQDQVVDDDDMLEVDQPDNDSSESDDEAIEESVIKESATRHRRRALDHLATISVAPGEQGEFQNWKGDVFLEEKSFPHLFPYGCGGYLSSCLSSKKNMGFAVYCRNRLRSVDPKFRNDQIYIFFLLLVKELVELKNCQSTYLRQARNTPGLSKQHITDMRYHNLQRYNRSFSVFKKMRGTSSFFEAAKTNLMATIRQKGAPTLFITLSSAEYQWESLIKAVYETVNRAPFTDEIKEGLTTAEKRKLITDNVCQTTVHFQKRIERVIREFMKPGFFEQSSSTSIDSGRENGGGETGEMEYQDEDREEDEEESEDAPSYFYRIEFQARGAPHVHLLAWCKDSSLKSYPNLHNADDIPQRLLQIAEYHDRMIKVNINDEVDDVLKLNLERFQVHNCTFTCAKKRKNVTVQAGEGWGADISAPDNATALVAVPICRFGFPRNPMDETVALLGFKEDDDEEFVKQAKKDYLQIRKFLLRQTFVPKGEKRDEQTHFIALQDLEFEDFLRKVGMFKGINSGSEEEQMSKARERYHTALRAGIKGQLTVFPKRDTKSLFVNGFNPKLMQLQSANHDIQYCADPYAVAQYVSGYLTKNESGMSALLKKVDEEFKSLPEIEKIKKFAAVLDKHREVSIQECIYRLLGLPMAKFSVKVKYLSASAPNHRDGLLRRNLEDLKDEESIFYPSIHQYYERRPDAWTEGRVKVDGAGMCLADWVSQYDHFATGKATKGGIFFEGDAGGWFRRRRQRAVLRYFLRQDDEAELSRGLCILFLPFKNEVAEIHEKDPTDLLAKHGDVINANRSRFETNNLVSEMIERLEKQREKGDQETDDEEEDDTELETTERYQIEEHQQEYDKSQAIASLPKEDESRGMSILDLRKLITSLNPQQRQIFDEIMERINEEGYDSRPFYIYLAGEAGTGKSYVIMSVMAAVKHLTAKSGQDLDKPSTLVLAPSATAAFLVNGKTIESGLQFTMGRHGGYTQGSADKMTKLAFEYEDLALCILEEVSMIGSNKFAVINYRMQHIALGPKRNEFMGGTSILAVGDFRQVKRYHINVCAIASNEFLIIFSFSFPPSRMSTSMKTRASMGGPPLLQIYGESTLTSTISTKR